MNFITRYTRWLHTQWPAGQVENLPEVGEEGRTNLSGVRIVGDLTGVPLLKFSADTGARAVQSLGQEGAFSGKGEAELDLAIVGAGVSGLSAAIEAKKLGLQFALYEASEAFSTIKNFPRRKPIYTYPKGMTPAGEMRFESTVKEDLLEELSAQRDAHGIQAERARVERLEQLSGGRVRVHFAERESLVAKRVLVAIGRTGNFRKLNVPGEGLEKVGNRLLDATDYAGQRVLIVGGGDSALEAAHSLAEAGAQVDLSYRKEAFSRPKPDNLEKLKALEGEGTGKIKLHLKTQLQEIREDKVELQAAGANYTLPNDAVMALIGREPPLDFFRRSKLKIAGEWTAGTWFGLIAFFIAFTLFYHWQKEKWFTGIDPNIVAWAVSSVGGLFQSQVDNSQHLLHTLRNAMNGPGFYYSLAYCSCVVAFGIRRIRRRKTPYIKLQTITLALIQIIPLFLLPYILLPWAGANGWWEAGFGGWLANAFFPNGEYWRAFGFVLAWPLFVYNWFTADPLWGWLILGFIQTFVIIPLLIWRWGKGAYCGWICSCGALAETMGDAHRHKMPHGPIWNRLNMIGQVVLLFAAVIMLFRIIGWVLPEGNFAANAFQYLFQNLPILNYAYAVDIWLAGVFGVAFYFHFSGRVWCRFACPLAALMHIYTRFSRFRIFSEKKRCISCNVCTSVCHQGIDVMAFASRGVPMEDPECVRCSACVQSCPTGVLQFGRFRGDGSIAYDQLPASPVLMAEETPVERYLAAAKQGSN